MIIPTLPKIKLAGIDTTMKCNLSCLYCSAHDEMRFRKNNSQSIFRIEQFFKKLKELQEINYFDNPNFVWFGGEPLLFGIDNFIRVIELQQSIFKNQRIYNQINTNATLLNEAWINFFIKYDIDLILSIDGPDSINDKRVYASGKKAYRDIIRGFQLVKESGIPVKYISVVTNNNCSHVEEMYAFTKTWSPYSVEFLPCFSSRKEPNVTNENYAKFLINLYDLWKNDDDKHKPKRITTLSSIEDMLNTNHTSSCIFGGNCGGRFYLDIDGNIRYCCNLFEDAEITNLGKIEDLDLRNQVCLGSNLYQIRTDIIKLVKECESCEVYNVCGGGCASQRKELNGRIHGSTYYCIARKSVIKHIMNAIS